MSLFHLMYLAWFKVLSIMNVSHCNLEKIPAGTLCNNFRGELILNGSYLSRWYSHHLLKVISLELNLFTLFAVTYVLNLTLSISLTFGNWGVFLSAVIINNVHILWCHEKSFVGQCIIVLNWAFQLQPWNWWVLQVLLPFQWSASFPWYHSFTLSVGTNGYFPPSVNGLPMLLISYI